MNIRIIRELNHRGRRLRLRNYRKRVYEVKANGETAVLVRFVPDERNRILYENNIAAITRLEELGVRGPRLLYRNDNEMEFATTHQGEQLDVFIARQDDRGIAEAAICEAVAYVADMNERSATGVPFYRPEYIQRVVMLLEDFSGEERESFWSRLPNFRELVKYMDAMWANRCLPGGFGMTDLHISNLAIDSQGHIAMFDLDHYRPHYNLNYLLSYVSVTLGWAVGSKWADLPSVLDREAHKCNHWDRGLFAYGKIACHTTKLLDRYVPEVRGMEPKVPFTTEQDVEQAIEEIERIARDTLYG